MAFEVTIETPAVVRQTLRVADAGDSSVAVALAFQRLSLDAWRVREARGEATVVRVERTK